MTQKQLQLVKLINNYKSTTGEAPTYSEMKKAIGVTSNQTVSDHLDALERSGLIKRSDGKKRGIVLTKRGEDAAKESRVDSKPHLLDTARWPAIGGASSAPVVNNATGQSVVTLTTTFYGGKNVTYNWDNQSSGGRISS